MPGIHPRPSVRSRLVFGHLETYPAQRQTEDTWTPAHVEETFRAYLRCGLLPRVAYRQWVLSMPKRLRHYARHGSAGRPIAPPDGHAHDMAKRYSFPSWWMSYI